MSTDVEPRADRELSDCIAEEIRAMLGRRRMSQAELARKLGTSGAWLNYRLTGKQPIDVNDLAEIAASLGVTVTELIPTGGFTTGRRRGRGGQIRTTAYGPSRHVVMDRPQSPASRPPTYGANRRTAETRPGAIQRRRIAA